MEHLNAKLGMELGKMNEKIEVSLAMGRRELNDGLQTIAKMIKSLPLDSQPLVEEGSEMKSSATSDELTESATMGLEKKNWESGENHYCKLELPCSMGSRFVDF